MEPKAVSAKKPYSSPELRKLNREQATLFLLGHAWEGNVDAQELLRLLFPDPNDENPK